MKNPKVKGRKESLILRELTIIMQRELENEILKSVSISEVRLVNDNELARVYYSFLPFSGQNITEQKVEEALEKNKGRIRKALASKLKIRYTPDLEFVYDTSLDNANRIEDILKKVNN